MLSPRVTSLTPQHLVPLGQDPGHVGPGCVYNPPARLMCWPRSGRPGPGQGPPQRQEKAVSLLLVSLGPLSGTTTQAWGAVAPPFPGPEGGEKKAPAEVGWHGRGGEAARPPAQDAREAPCLFGAGILLSATCHTRGFRILRPRALPGVGGAAGGTRRELTGTQLHATQGGVACARRVGGHEERCAMRTSPGQERLHSRPKPLPTAVVHGPRPTCPSHTRLPGAVSTRARGAGGGWNSPKAQEADGGRGAG